MSLLDALFRPRRVALVGASDRPGSLGQVLAANLADFPGEVVPVRGGESLRDVAGPIDLAVVSVPAKAVPAVAADAAAAGVEAMVVLSGGFAETGPDGAALQEELVAAAGSVRVVGPNCFGIQNCDLPLNASMATGLPDGGGGISLVSQSGAYGMAIRTLAVDERTRFAKILAPGNTCDVSIAELLGELAADPATRTLCFLLESLSACSSEFGGRAFVEAARRTGAEKPVIVAKTGRSDAGVRAAASHTAALAATRTVWEGVFRQAGIVEVASGQELLDVARALDGQPRPTGDRVAVITNSGGVGVELCDLLADEGLAVPALSPGLQERIRAMLPPFASPVNPVDVTPVWSRFAELYPALTDLLARSGEVDVVVPVLLQRAAMDAATAEGLRDAVAALRADGVEVPVAVCWVAPRDARPNADLLQESGVPCFEWPARTARALGHAQRWARRRERRPVAPRPVVPVAAPPPLDPEAGAAFLARFGVATARSVTCADPDEAVAAATTFPVVVKIAGVAHRTELGGVRVGLSGAADVRAAAQELLAHGPVLVQPQLTGVEVAVGALRDPVFGPVVMVGLGGIWIEVLADVAFALAPLDRADARELLTRLRGFPLLTGARGAAPVDLDALADTIVGAGDALVAGDVGEIDLNPVLATPAGVVAVDWKVS
ncbi:acetate--CoA ligase family protein [Actinomycetospora sp. TBRC 11914]|uniref:acetate--CoA ligase family protein n=1 Tax=Actinomycetospora sp. TBRC 11914 TaxID=2729387 RepID=UPI00145E9B95|nr:acetate--CoA ligase family protein [Actinomycetospora sp. TBRC 11914]NMO92082.1 acetate--CoA ligase family protein [Actinomycetospora sp. TBRC 11914]